MLLLKQLERASQKHVSELANAGLSFGELAVRQSERTPRELGDVDRVRRKLTERAAADLASCSAHAGT